MRGPRFIAVTVALLYPSRALAEMGVAHEDPMAAVALWLAVILIVAKVGGDLAARLGQPAVLGELLGGILSATSRSSV